MSGATYRLVDEGYGTFKKIFSGRKAIGRVSQTPHGYFGKIGQTIYQGRGEGEVFNEVVARYCGYANYTAMAERDASVRLVNRQKKAERQYVLDEMIQGNFKPLDRLIKKELG